MFKTHRLNDSLLAVVCFICFSHAALAVQPALKLIGEGGPATEAALEISGDMAYDLEGHLLIVDTQNHLLRKVTKEGNIITVAGTFRLRYGIADGGLGGDGGPANRARLQSPEGIAVDPSGAFYIADTWNRRVRKIDPNGIITTVAGTGRPPTYSLETLGQPTQGDGGPATLAPLNAPRDVAVDAGGNLYIADGEDFRIRKVGPDGIITTAAGSGPVGIDSGGIPYGEHGGDGGPAVNARLQSPAGIALDRSGNLYIADGRVRKVGTDGTIETVAGNGQTGASGDGGPATQAGLRASQVAVDTDGTLYLSDSLSKTIRKVNPSGIISTFVTVWVATGLMVDSEHNLLYFDVHRRQVRKVDPQNQVFTLAGGGTRGIGDGGPATEALFWNHFDVARDRNGSLYVLDEIGARVRKIDTDGRVTTAAGTGECCGFDGEGIEATRSRLFYPMGIGVDGDGRLLIADTINQRVRRVDAAGRITTVAGNGAGNAPYAGSFSGDGGPATQAALNLPSDVATDGEGNLYIADRNNHRIRKVDIHGTITTVAGSGPIWPDEGGFSGDGGPAVAARLSYPNRVEVDGQGNLFISDAGNNRIRRVDRNGTLTTVAGDGASEADGDGGPAVQASFTPRGLAVDPLGNLFISDSRARNIRKVDPNGIITTFAGYGREAFSGDGGPAIRAAVSYVQGITVDSTGNLYVGDAGNHCVRKVDPQGVISTIGGLPPEEGPALGDVAFNGTIDVEDAILVLKSVVGQVILSAEDKLTADVTRDRQTDVHDAVKLLRITVGMGL